ncbi:uncharacterized protein I206_106145 [Kwoniella pini CBS 10737]|uniref:Peptidase A1 domain-containing protein n=1 Tax=Kwoniella pini CBS 10737 TaxID=1296096 RepID=A0A1B9I1F7_9TREE|nr:uncharacterized protein I206_04970 [Kwoniella pini CBS 10737]OCF49281.1 hypothetical protein I206_04970 [Kwoniella pini CBS 10737]
MITTQHILTVLTLLSISLASLPPAHHPAQNLETSPSSIPEIRSKGYLPKIQNRRKSTQLYKRGPSVGISDVNLEIHERAASVDIGKGKRALNVNGTEVNLGTAQNTYVVPVSIGSPASIYPLQLDLASSDLLVASTLCTTTTCPTSLGPTVNAYYDVSKGSSGFEVVNGNKTYWNSSYADGTTASGIVVREVLTMGEVVLDGQVMGLMNATNLTLSQQKISGIIGLGFPRLSALSHILLEPTTADDTSSSSSSASISASSAANSASSSISTSSASSVSTTSSSKATPTYYPPVLENLVSQPHVPYPVFALALAPPPSNTTSTSTATSSSATSSSTSRYQSQIGSLTLGGVSNHYISNDTDSGRTVDDIEWHQVIPFGKAKSSTNDSAQALSRTNTISSTAISTSASTTPTSSSSANGDSSRKKRSSSSELNTFPSNLDELGDEEYLFWTLELHNLSLNGTDITLNSSYADLGLGSLALLDVGFNGISGPQQDVVKIFEKISDARQVDEGQWVVPCNTKMTLGFSFGGRYIQLQPSDWISTQIDSSSLCLAWPIVAPSTGDGMDWQLGTPFLKKVYSIFSYGINGIQAPLVGFLPLENNPTSTNSGNGTNTTTYNPDSPTPTTIEELHLTTTIQTILPNQILPDPTYTTPSYVYSTILQTGINQYIGLANNSIYSEIEEVPVVSLDSAATSRMASMAGGENGGSAASGSGTSGASKNDLSLIGIGMISGLFLGVFGILGHL